MHCVAGDGVGILAGAVCSGFLHLAGSAEMILEYVLGFGFGWTIFQALFMREMAGGSYSRSLIGTFAPELLSMNLLMAGMIPTMMALKMRIASAGDPSAPAFWFVMSMALLVGSVLAYPINWWLVAYQLKHGMMTVRPAAASAELHGNGHGGAHGTPAPAQEAAMEHTARPVPSVPVMAVLSFLALAAGVAITRIAAPM
jgi:hypothetical protein